MTRIDIEQVRVLRQQLKDINSIPLEDIEWYENGVPVDIDPAVVSEFAFIGLNNVDFIDGEFYKCKGTVWDIDNADDTDS
jgi:hypothetical protein